ncbi:Cytochrome P450 monooxygenase patH [Lachnellula suecica]|uniref:Cytochrome P450 monooxygenase patH n=1 Tax=Lachnellula suecica TaxID=602035 RepID=A0A8T9CB58_9HELO|nr:Cytochrome P450 monooxygenase patH [Lachnellula suecica]
MGLIIGTVTVLTALVLIAIRELCKPVDKKWKLGGKKWKLPPGPLGSPIVGNLWQFSKARDTGKLIPYLHSLAEYGEMTTLHMGTRTWVLLNSDRVVSDIILKQGKITGERPSMPIASGLVSNGKRTVIRQTADWQEGRRVMHHLLSGSALKVYGDWYETESIRLLSAYLTTPKNWFAHHFKYATSVLYLLVLGEPFSKSKKELNEYQQVTMEFVMNINRHFVDFFPWLAQLPSVLQFWAAPWKKMGAFHRKVFLDWWTPVVTAIDNGVAPASFTRDTLLHPDTKYQGTREEAMYLATSVMAAGGDNTRMTLNTFVMAMISYPAAQRRLQAELDACCGTGESLRLPTLSDMSSMPYCAAMVKEVLRWRPTVPVVGQHHLTAPLEYDGYVFPPGTDFLINNIGLQYQEWDDRDSFRPERFIDGSNETNPIHKFWGFGGGRRICVGYRVAQQSLFVSFARIAYCFDILADGEFDDKRLNHLSLSEPFPVKMEPRSEAHRNMILKEEKKLK